MTGPMSWRRRVKKQFIDGNQECPGCGRNYEQIKAVRPPGRKDAELITLDHIYPKSLGGETIEWNIRVVCFDCNSLKGDRWPFDWAGGQYLIFAREVEWPTDPDPKEVEGEEEAWEWDGHTVQTYMDRFETGWSIRKGEMINEIEQSLRET